MTRLVRHGTTNDVDCVVDLAITAHSKSPYSHIAYDAFEIRRNVILSVTMPFLCCFVSEKDGALSGALVGTVGKNVWGAIVACDQGIYASKPGEGIKLIDQFLDWAKDSGAHMVNLTNSFGDERYDRVLEKRYGLIYTGGNFIGEL